MRLAREVRHENPSAGPLAALIAVLAVTFLLLIARRKTLSGKVDASTPLVQNGFILADVEGIDRDGRCPYGGPGWDPKTNSEYVGGGDAINDDPGGVGLWIRQPEDAPERPLDITARSSTGDVYHLRAMNTAHSPPSGGWLMRLFHPSRPVEPMALVHFPGGYPDDYRWMDVTVRDKQGHQARWRLINLPRSQHRILPPVTVQDTVRVGDVTLQAQLWREPATPEALRGGIGYRLDARLPENSPFVWNIPTPQNECEWEPPLYAPPKTDWSTGGWSGGGEMSMGGMPFPAYYLRRQKYASLHTVLQQFAKREETLTFHNLTVKTVGGKDPQGYLILHRPLSLTTASGLSVTLPAQGVWPPSMTRQDPPNGPNLRLMMTSLPNSLPTLPASPLYRKYRKPVLLDVFPGDVIGDDGKTLPRFGSSGGGSGGAQRYEIRLSKPQPHLTHLKSPTVAITQRVLLRQTPVRFTVPIGDIRPKGF